LPSRPEGTIEGVFAGWMMTVRVVVEVSVTPALCVRSVARTPFRSSSKTSGPYSSSELRVALSKAANWAKSYPNPGLSCESWIRGHK
jgi:hypothetical protein